MPEKSAARSDWEQRIGTPSDDRLTGIGELPAPTGPRAEDGTGLVLLDWRPVEGALGYLVHRAERPEGPFLPLDHLGGDVLPARGRPAAAGAAGPGHRGRGGCPVAHRGPPQPGHPLPRPAAPLTRAPARPARGPRRRT